MNPGRLLDLDLHAEFPADLRAASVPISTDEIDQDANGKRVVGATLTLRETRTGPTKEIVTVETRDGWKYRMQRFDGDQNLTLWRRDKPDGSGVGRRAALPVNVEAVVEAIEVDEITPDYVDEAAAEQAIGDAAASPSTTVQAEAGLATDGGQERECARCGTSEANTPDDAPVVLGEFDTDSPVVNALADDLPDEAKLADSVTLCDGCHVTGEAEAGLLNSTEHNFSDGDTWTCGGCKATWTTERVEDNPDEFGTHSCPSCPTDDDLRDDSEDALTPRADPRTWAEVVAGGCPECDAHTTFERRLVPVTATTGAWGKYVRAAYECDECGHEALLKRSYEDDEQAEAMGRIEDPKKPATDGGEEPRTDAPTDGPDDYDRFGCQLNPGDDKSEPCPNCGCEALDFWMHEGATGGITICVECGEHVHEWDPRDGLDRIDDGLRADGSGGDEWDLPPEERGRATEKAARKRRAEDGHERMQRERTGVAGDPVPDHEYGDQGASMEELTGEAPPAARQGEIVVAEFRAKDASGHPSGREEYDPGEVWATCSECGYGGIIDDDAENVNADHPDGPGRLVCRECADRYERDQPDVDGEHQVRESVQIGGTPFPTDRLMQFAGDAIDAVGGGQVLAHGETWLLLDLPDDVDAHDDPEFPEAILDDAHDRGLRVGGILWRYGVVRFEDPGEVIRR